MKKLYIADILVNTNGQQVEILGWVKSIREHGGVVFFDLIDSTGEIQIVANKSTQYILPSNLVISPESSVKIKGVVKQQDGKTSKEIDASEIELIGLASLDISPRPRTNFDIFSPALADYNLHKRHLVLRNEKMMATLKFRHIFFKIVHDWFREQSFIEIHAPVLTQIPLYEESSAFKVDFFGTKVFLTQCVAFYLESAVHAFEKVYNLGPSFRAEKSRGKRHLAEYWHVKAEIAFADLEDIMHFVESMTAYISSRIAIDAKKELEFLGVSIDTASITNIPYPRITYDEAIAKLKDKGFGVEWGKSLGNDEETSLSEEYTTPFWITGLPRSIEPFPYAISPSNINVTKTADLIAPSGFGELLGVAEKIWQPEELAERMKEKGRDGDNALKWYSELRQYGSVPHSGLGMGAERFMRWLLQLGHVRDVIPFPRMFRRPPYP